MCTLAYSTCFPGLSVPNGISVDSVGFAGLPIVTDKERDRPTEHVTPSVAIDRLYT